MKLQQAIQKFIEDQTGLVASTTMEWHIKYLKPLSPLADKSVRRITTDDLRCIWNELATREERWSNHPSGRAPAEGGLSPFTLANYVRCWRGFFRWCVEEGFAKQNPAERLPMPALPDQPPKALSPENLGRLLQAAKDSPRDYAIVCFLADTGCRVGGLVKLNLDDVSLCKGRATVTEKGRGGGKTRTVYLKPRTRQAMRDYFVVRPEGDSNRVFLGTKGPLTTGGVYCVIKRLAQGTKICGKWNPHAFRHGFARGAIENGADLSEVAQLLGHDDVSVTAKFYARWDDDELKVKHNEVSWLPDDDGE